MFEIFRFCLGLYFAGYVAEFLIVLAQRGRIFRKLLSTRFQRRLTGRLLISYLTSFNKERRSFLGRFQKIHPENNFLMRLSPFVLF